MKSKVQADGGICGFKTVILAASEDDQHVTFEIISGCEKVRGLAAAVAELGPIDAYQEIGVGHSSKLMQVTRSTLQGCCAGCVTPVALFRAMQIAAGLALPKDVTLRITQE